MHSLSFVLLAASAGADPVPEVLHQNFAGGAVSEVVFKRVGPEPKRFMRAHPAGLRITLPEKESLPPIGVASRLAVHGDFEITATYQILNVGKPKKGYGAGVRLWIGMESPAADAATLARCVRPREGDVLSTDHGQNDPEGKRKHKELYFPTTATTGKLRLARSGSTLVYSAADGGALDFQELRREEFGAAPLKGVQFAADAGGVPAEVDVVLVDLEIRSRELSASAALDPQAGRTFRSAWVAALVLGVTLAAAGLAYSRRGRGGRKPG